MTHTPLTKAERDELRRLHNAATTAPWNGDWSIVTDDGDPIATTDVSLASDPAAADNDGPLIVAARNALPRLLADLDAAEAERDEIKAALGVMGATRERVLEVAGSLDALEELIDSMSRERDVALNGWSAAEAARDAAAAQRDRAESELDAERRMRVEAEAAAKRAEEERDALKAQIDAAESAHSELFLSGQVAGLRGKLAALAEAASEFYEATYEDAIQEAMGSADFVLRSLLGDAIAAARGGAS